MAHEDCSVARLLAARRREWFTAADLGRWAGLGRGTVARPVLDRLHRVGWVEIEAPAHRWAPRRYRVTASAAVITAARIVTVVRPPTTTARAARRPVGPPARTPPAPGPPTPGPSRAPVPPVLPAVSGRVACGYLHAALLGAGAARTARRELADWCRAHALDLAATYVETAIGARLALDELHALLRTRTGPGRPVVVVPSLAHLAVNPRRQSGLLDELDALGAEVVETSGMAGGGWAAAPSIAAPSIAGPSPAADSHRSTP